MRGYKNDVYSRYYFLNSCNMKLDFLILSTFTCVVFEHLVLNINGCKEAQYTNAFNPLKTSNTNLNMTKLSLKLLQSYYRFL